MPLLSVIIPTYKRADILQRCLHHLSTQTIAKDLEIIVVSDGHDEETERRIRDLEFGIWNFRFFEIQKSQQGMARNFGVKHATAPIVLFIGDDIFLEPHACAMHAEWRMQNGEDTIRSENRSCANSRIPHSTFHIPSSCAVLGFTTWDPSLGITPVMRWLESSGWQFGYPLLKEYTNACIPPDIQHRFTYTSHISLPTSIAKRFPFREDVTLYGWEDIEWGMRLRDAGIPLFYTPDARALHHHHITMESSLARMEVLGASAVTMETLCPGFDRTPKGWKRLLYEILAQFPTMAGKHRRAFLAGMKKYA